jgi:hypothetical protein
VYARSIKQIDSEEVGSGEMCLAMVVMVVQAGSCAGSGGKFEGPHTAQA